MLSDEIRAAALRYEEAGWHLVLLGGKKPIIPGWAGVRPAGMTIRPNKDNKYHGEISPGIGTIAEQAEEHPYGNNIGLICGHKGRAINRGPGAVVIDIDRKGNVDGVDSMNTIIKRYGNGLELPKAPKALTPSGGLHLFFAMPPPWTPATAVLKNRVGRLFGKSQPPTPGVDLRADGGQVVLAPSVTEQGEYRWLRGLDEFLANELPQLPSWLLEPMVAFWRDERPPPAPKPFKALTPEVHEEIREEQQRMANARKGTRNEMLNKGMFHLGRLVRLGKITEASAIDLGITAAEASGYAREHGRNHARNVVLSALDAGKRKR